MGVALFQLVTREGCHLCEVMEDLLEEVLPGLGVGYERLDVDKDPELMRRFGEVVPVLLREGKPVAKVRLERERLVRLVKRRRV